MTSPKENLTLQLHQCLALAKSVETHPEAQQQFAQLQHSLKDKHPELVDLIELLWQETIAAYRSVGFWQQMSNIEKEMASNMMKAITEMRQNYLRLMQEM